MSACAACILQIQACRILHWKPSFLFIGLLHLAVSITSTLACSPGLHFPPLNCDSSNGLVSLGARAFISSGNLWYSLFSDDFLVIAISGLDLLPGSLCSLPFVLWQTLCQSYRVWYIFGSEVLEEIFIGEMTYFWKLNPKLSYETA